MSLQIEHLKLISYRKAYDRQMQLVTKLHDDKQADDVCLILEHEAVFTLGRNGSSDNVTVAKSFLQERGIELLTIERGGEVTYHGPGQVVCYPILNLRHNQLSVTEYIHSLEEIMLAVVHRFGITANRDSRNHGIWCGDQKLGSVGIAVRHGISYHGLALNVSVNLEPFSWMNPCGLTGVSMASMESILQKPLNYKAIEAAMAQEITRVFQRPAKKQKACRIAKPKWLKQPLPSGSGYERTRRLLSTTGLTTVCQEARCPNQFECFGKGAATFMLMGESCTRNCSFCAVEHGKIKPLDSSEPEKIAKAVHSLGLKYAVLTSVTRDDLPDGGAKHFALTVDAIRKLCPEILVELLIPDLQGDAKALQYVCKYKPSVLNHNIETVASLYPKVRPQAVYARSLDLLRRVKTNNPDIVTKTGLMLGLGESREELTRTMNDIRDTGCNLLTLGQYLQPTVNNIAVNRYVSPEEFETIRKIALDLGFEGVAADPHVRSSYQAEELYKLAI